MTYPDTAGAMRDRARTWEIAERQAAAAERQATALENIERAIRGIGLIFTAQATSGEIAEAHKLSHAIDKANGDRE